MNQNHVKFFRTARPEEIGKFTSYQVEEPNCGKSFEQDLTRVRFIIKEPQSVKGPAFLKYGIIVEFENRVKVPASIKHICDVAYWALTNTQMSPFGTTWKEHFRLGSFDFESLDRLYKEANGAT